MWGISWNEWQWGNDKPKCLTCKEGYHFIFQTNNCYNNSILEEGYYFSQKDLTYHKCDTNCKKCLQDSTFNNSICISCINNTYLFSLNNSCLHFCPPNYEINNDHNKWILKHFDQTTSLSDFKDQIINDITSLVDSSYVINGSDFIAMVFSSDDMDPKDQIKKGRSAIDLCDCTKVIKKHYNISEEESLIVLNIE